MNITLQQIIKEKKREQNMKVSTNLHELGGTVGGLIAVTWKPDLNKCLLHNNGGG